MVVSSAPATAAHSKPPSPPIRAWVPGVLESLVKIAAIGVPILYTFGRVYAASYWDVLRLPTA